MSLSLKKLIKYANYYLMDKYPDDSEKFKEEYAELIKFFEYIRDNKNL